MLKKSVIFLPLSLSGCIEPIAFGGVGAVGMSAVEERGFGGVVSDQALRVRLNFELSNKLSDFAGISLTVYKGRVLLTGVAANEQTKIEAVRVTKNVSGVRDVIDAMNIQGEDGFSEYTRDAWLTTKLKAALYADQDIYAPNYLIHTFDKVIYIFGVALTKEEMLKVLEHARDITGVKKVVNLIEVAGTPQKQ